MCDCFVVVVRGGLELLCEWYVVWGKMFFCDCVVCLFDEGSLFFEVVLFVVYGLYGVEVFGVGVIVGIGLVYG